MTLEALEFAMTFTVKSKPQALLGDDDINSYNDFKAEIEANDDASASAMEGILNLSTAFWKLLQPELWKKVPYTFPLLPKELFIARKQKPLLNW